MPDTGMDAESAVSPGEKEPPLKKAKARPDFTSDEKYKVLAAIFDVDHLSELNDKDKFRLSAFQEKAAQLLFQATGVQKAAGAFNSWANCIETILNNYSAAAKENNAAAADAEIEAGGEQVEDGDAAVAEALAVVERMLSGEEIDADFIKGLSPEDINQYETALLRHLDTLEAGVREQFEVVLSSEDKTVSSVMEIVKVSHSAPAASFIHPSLPCRILSTSLRLEAIIAIDLRVIIGFIVVVVGCDQDAVILSSCLEPLRRVEVVT